MAQWRKIITSGSAAELLEVTASLGFTVGGNSITNNPATTFISGVFAGDGSGLTGIPAENITLQALTAGNGLATSNGNYVGNNATTFSVNTSSAHFTDGVKQKLNADQVISGSSIAALLPAGTVSGSSQINHDATTNFVANEHIDHSTVSILAGSGLLGGGTIAASRTLSVNSGSMLPFFSSSIFGTVSGDILITSAGVATIQPNSVTLGTDTTGNYVATIGSSSGITITNNTGEGSTPNLSVNYGSTSNTAVQGNTNITINGTSNSIDVIGTAAQALGGGPSYTLRLPQTISGSINFSHNITVDGDLTVNGTVTTLNTANLLVEDKFILLNSGSANPDEGGIIIDEGSGTGHALIYEADAGIQRWGFNAAVAHNATTANTTAYAAAVVDLNNGNHSDSAEYRKNGNIRIDTNGDIWIYS